jgi:hypothetical protein
MTKNIILFHSIPSTISGLDLSASRRRHGRTCAACQVQRRKFPPRKGNWKERASSISAFSAPRRKPFIRFSRDHANFYYNAFWRKSIAVNSMGLSAFPAYVEGPETAKMRLSAR